MASLSVIAGTTQDQRSRLLPCFHTSAIQRFHDLHSAISASALSATRAIHMVLNRICTSMPSLSMCFKRNSTSRSSRASGAVLSSRPVCLDSAISSCSVNVGGRKPTDLPSTNQYCMLGLSVELKSCGRNLFSASSRKSQVCSVSTTWASASTIMIHSSGLLVWLYNVSRRDSTDEARDRNRLPPPFWHSGGAGDFACRLESTAHMAREKLFSSRVKVGAI